MWRDLAEGKLCDMTRHSEVPTRRRDRALTVTAAVLAGVFAWSIVVPWAGIVLVVHSGQTQQVGVAQVALASLAAGAGAWALLAMLERFTAAARRIWTVIAETVLVLSLGAGPLNAGNVSAGLSLACLHLLVGGAVIFGLRRTADTAGMGTPKAPTSRAGLGRGRPAGRSSAARAE